ncbi:hypothetical protein E8E14_000792 [Neopestalotiopsis sp. 37M]|nr:hypothetical protein E8E14_000792 [Neopestalotiopsis sp. 37M]
MLVHGLPSGPPSNPPDHQNPHLALHHNISVSGPPPQHFHSLPTVPSHGEISLGVLNAANPSVFHQHAHPHPHTHSLPELTHLPTDPAVPIHRPPPLTHPLDAPASITAHPPPPPPPPHSAPPSHGPPVNRPPSFGIAPPAPLPPAIAQLQQDDEFNSSGSSGTPLVVEPAENRPHGQLVNKIVVDPPDLEVWRNRFFNVDEPILLTNDEFETYFPHIDNVYSHRSTQKYKRKPFVSHYWDCRMKGRPPGTPKSNDPLKKKRKRSARERDLCDVKIKITEYFPGATLQLDDGVGSYTTPRQLFDANGMPMQPGANGEKFWTVQRVNGNGGNGKGDGVAGPHKHSLAKSDEIKKSTVQRFINAQNKESKKTAKPAQKKASGAAMVTARKHAKDHELKLYAACFCPFSQRVWIALEVKQMQYQYCEIDPYKRTQTLLDANPRGTIMDRSLPSYLALLKAIDPSQQSEHQNRLNNDVRALVQAADERGPYFLGVELCLVDIHFAPFALRLSRVLAELRGWQQPPANPRWEQWIDAIENNSHIQATTSNSDLYLETAELSVTGQQHSHL